MSVSIITPAYNAADTIAETLDSVLAQSYDDWEVVVVDDGSTDTTAATVARYTARDGRIRMIRQANGGESAARNTGLDHARHDLIVFLDADDWLAPSYLAQMTGALAADPALSAVHCRWARVTQSGEQLIEAYEAPAGDMFSTWAKRSAFPVHACVVRRSAIQGIGAFDLGLRRSADWDFWQRVARTGALFGALPDVLAFYRIRPTGVSLDAQYMLEDGLTVLRRGHAADPRVVKPHPDHAHGAPAAEVDQQVYYLLSWCAGLMLGRGEDARDLLSRASAIRYPALHPESIAECIFGAATLPSSDSSARWEQLWPQRRTRVEEFLSALEAQSGTPDLSRRARTRLVSLALDQAPSWRPALEAIRGEHALLLADRDQRLAEQLQQNAREREAQQALLAAAAREHSAAMDAVERQRQEREREQDAAIAALQSRLASVSRERDSLLHAPERHLGDVLLNRLKLGVLWRHTSALWSRLGHQLCLARLRLEGRLGQPTHRILATVCWNFPIYSQTFVYQELNQLIRRGYSLRLIYSRRDPRDQLGPQFDHLWALKRRLFLHRGTHARDFEHYRRRMPVKVDALVTQVSEASGLSRDHLLQHDNFLQAFSFTRMVEAYRPAYLHSYFFYDRSLMTLVAAHLLGIPRGITCYADHVLTDYELKVVPLHLALADVVVATSARIKAELLALAPDTPPDRIIIKPNSVDTAQFAHGDRVAPAEGEPWRVVAVNRIEPKKGLEYLVEAVGILRTRGIPIEAHIIGEPDEWSAASLDAKRILDERITSLGLWGKVHLEGRQNADGVRRFLRMAQLFVAPYVETSTGDKDGIPTALLEAMSTGLPVVATDAGSIVEAVQDGEEGVIVPQRDSHALADAIESLLRDKDRRFRWGAAAGKKAREHFDVVRCEKDLHDRIREVIARSRDRNDVAR